MDRDNGIPLWDLKEEPQGVGRSQTSPVFSIDDIMWRVRAEVTRRRNGKLTSVAVPPIPTETRSFDLSAPRWNPAIPRLPVKDTYHVAELLAHSDADFLDGLYRAILRRPPDEDGFNHFLRLLRNSQATKLEIISAFLSSPESKPWGVRVEGIERPALLEKWRRKRIIGPIIAWVHALANLGKQADRRAAVETSQAREIQELGRVVNEGSEYLLQRISALKVEFAGRVRSSEFERLKSDINRMSVTLESTARSVEQQLAREDQEKKAISALDPFYAAFEDRFRGDRSLIRTRAEPYLALMREAGAGTPEAPILDIGCGRGEWLELLRDSGLTGKGIEINRVFVEGCRARGLDVLEGDAIGLLRAMPDSSAGAATAIHVIEHLPFERAIALLDELRRVLRPDGLLILETPNPENLSVGHLWFYMDPTHQNPLPPEALRWIVEARGFHDVRIERLALARDQKTPVPIATDFPGADFVNALMASMSASLDYAIVGKR